jgi:hypothetical protein
MPDYQGGLCAREHDDLKVSGTANIGMQARHGCRRFSFGQ